MVDTIEVTVAEVAVSGGQKVRQHHGDKFHVDERGNLLIYNGSAACVYAPGQWLRAVKAGNEVTKG